MVSTVGKINSINVENNQKKMTEKNKILIGEKKNSTFTRKNLLFSLLGSISCCSHFVESIPKRLVLRIASKRYGHEAYPQQKLFRNHMHPQSANMVVYKFPQSL